MKITISVDDKLAELAGQVARERGTDLNELLQRFIASLAGERMAEARASAIVSLFVDNPRDSGEIRFVRDHAYMERL